MTLYQDGHFFMGSVVNAIYGNEEVEALTELRVTGGGKLIFLLEMVRKLIDLLIMNIVKYKRKENIKNLKKQIFIMKHPYQFN